MNNLLKYFILSVVCRNLGMLLLQYNGRALASHPRQLAQTSIQPFVAECRTGAQLAAALASTEVKMALLLDDFTLADSDFSAPIVLNRNFTIRGGLVSRPVVLNFNFIRGKVIMNGRIVLTIEAVMAVNYRWGSAVQQPGFDLVTAAPAGAGAAVLVFKEMILAGRFCWSPKISVAVFDMDTRPPGIPGRNVYKIPHPSPYICAGGLRSGPPWPPEDPAVAAALPWPLDGCFLGASFFPDCAFYGGDMNSDGTPNNSGIPYMVHMLDTFFHCMALLSDECVNKLTPLGCLMYALRQPVGSNSSSPRSAAVASPPGTSHRPPEQQHGQQGGDGDTSVIKNMAISITSLNDLNRSGSSAEGDITGSIGSSSSGSSSNHNRDIILGCTIGGGLFLVLLGGVFAAVVLHQQQRRASGRRGPITVTTAAAAVSKERQWWWAASRRRLWGWGCGGVAGGGSSSDHMDGDAARDEVGSSAASSTSPTDATANDQQRNGTPHVIPNLATADAAGSGPRRPFQEIRLVPGPRCTTTELANTEAVPLPQERTAVKERCGQNPPTVQALDTNPRTAALDDNGDGAVPLVGGGLQSVQTDQQVGEATSAPIPLGGAPATAAMDASADQPQQQQQQQHAAAGPIAVDGSCDGFHHLQDHVLTFGTPFRKGLEMNVRVRVLCQSSSAEQLPPLPSPTLLENHSSSAPSCKPPPALRAPPVQQGERGDPSHQQDGVQGGNPLVHATHALMKQQQKQPLTRPQEQQGQEGAIRDGYNDDHNDADDNGDNGGGERDLATKLAPGGAAPQGTPMVGSTALVADATGGLASQIAVDADDGPKAGGQADGQPLDSPGGPLVAQSDVGSDSIIALLAPSGGGDWPRCRGAAAAAPSEDGGGGEEEVVTILPVLLGRGHFGRVLRGRYRGAAVAVKTLHSAFTNEPPSQHAFGGGAGTAAALAREQHQQQLVQAGAWRTFLQEVEVLGRCQHPNVVRLLAACLAPPHQCLVMELMEMSLANLIFGDGSHGSVQLLPLETVVHITCQVASALAYLHPTIVHRDLKPQNVLINGATERFPVAKIADFGLSRLRYSTLPTETPEAGTHGYMAPECYDVRNYTITHHADIFSLGMLIWVMLSGQHPWRGLSVVSMAYRVAVLRQRPPVLHLPPGRCPPTLLLLMHHCWEHDPRRRPAAAEVLKVLLMLQAELARASGAAA